MFNEGDTQESSTDKPVALEFPIELEFDRDDNNNNNNNNNDDDDDDHDDNLNLY